MNVGFFYLRNAPISAQTQEQFIEKALGLFELPLEKKLEIEMVNSPHFLGYSRLGAEITALKPDYREQFDVSSGALSFIEVFPNAPFQFATELPAPGSDEPLYRNVVGPNQVRSDIWAFVSVNAYNVSGQMKQRSPDFVNHSTHICRK